MVYDPTPAFTPAPGAKSATQRAVEHASELLRQLSDAPSMSSAARERLLELVGALDVVSDEVEQLARYMDLDALLGGMSSIDLTSRCDDESRCFSRLDRSELKALRSELLVLDQLMRWGATPSGATIFSKRGLEVSRTIGEEGLILAPWLRQANYALNKGRDQVSEVLAPDVHCGQARAALLRLLEVGVLDEKPRVFAVGKEGTERRTRAIGSVSSDGELRALLNGHWLSGYARWLIADHAERNRVPAQLISRLEVELPRDTARRRRAEYDVLALLDLRGQRRLLWIECKAGSLRNISVDDIVASRDALERAASIDGDSQLRVDAICLTTGVVSKADRTVEPALRAALAEHDVALTAVSELRGLVHSLFGG